MIQGGGSPERIGDVPLVTIMLRINQLKLHPGHTSEEMEHKICTFLHIKRESLQSYRIIKQSVDARKKPEVFLSYVIDVQIKQEEAVFRRMKKQVQKAEEKKYHLVGCGGQRMPGRAIIAGSGPAGLFCAYLLAERGFRPLVLERGKCVEQRRQDVEAFWREGALDPDSNVQFGEGGAGTFSDGKLNTLVKDPAGRSRFVLETFVRHGAPESILYEQKPHIGTDVLSDVVRNMRQSIQGMGGEVRFMSQVTDIGLSEDTCSLRSVIVNGQEEIPAGLLVLAIGHSARDTFEMLSKRALEMQAKSFAVGVRIEHPQSMITKCQYGREEYPGLPAASYKLAKQLANGRGAYTFCMCPGGYVVNASSEKGRLAVNGMSYHARDGINANSAVIVTVTPKDYGEGHPLAGVKFQQDLEERAFRQGGGRIPVQCFGDFCRNEPTKSLGGILPQMKGTYALANVRDIFPDNIAESLEQGILAMDKKIPGFARADAVLSGVESRTSSPVRLPRNQEFESNIRGIYPCGEGAGYAGGITSAAMDGMKTAEAVIQKYRP